MQNKGLTIPKRDRPSREVAEIGDVQDPKTDWDRMSVPWMADQRDASTMIVIPAAQGLLDDLNELVKMYDFDGRTINRICTMTTKGMNSFLNDFTPRGNGEMEVNKKAMFMIKKMINQAEPDLSVKQWWRDPNASRNYDEKAPPAPRDEARGRSRSVGRGIKRGHSNDTRKHVTEDQQEYQDYRYTMDKIREDLGQFFQLNEREARALHKTCTYFHRTPETSNEVDREEGAMDLTSWEEIKDAISDHNFLRLAEVWTINDEMVECWKQGLNGRPARKFNALVGTEIEQMMKLVNDFIFEPEELMRHAKLDKTFLETCDHTRHGRCTKYGESCRKLHPSREQTTVRIMPNPEADYDDQHEWQSWFQQDSSSSHGW